MVTEGSLFSDCTSLISVELPASMTEIPSSTFSGCTSLESVIAKGTITSIGSSAFNECTVLKLSLIHISAILPFLLLIIASFTDDKTAILNGYSYFPEKWSFGAYEYLLQDIGKYARAYGMTILVTAIGTVVSIIITSMLAYMLSKRKLPGVKILNFLVIFTMLFNGGLVPTYMIYTCLLYTSIRHIIRIRITI